jgi:hypothetical protein
MYDRTVELLLNEAGLTTTCIEQGLTSLRKASFQNKPSYYQSFFLLTIGIERLLKLIIITIYRTEENTLPTNDDLKNYGHNIEKLFIKVAGHLNPNDLFLERDPLHKQIISFFSEYALISRYYNLDSLTGIEKTEDPLSKWKEIQKVIEKRHGKPTEINSLHKEALDILNTKVFIITKNEQGKNINTATDYFLEFTNLEIVQGHSVYYTYQVICYLVDLLNQLSRKKHLLPYFNEFFILFNNPMDKKDVIKRKNWNYMMTKR